MNGNNYIKLFSNCIAVSGASRSAICDVQFDKLYCIPSALYKLTNVFDSLNANEIIKYYGAEHEQTVQEYIDFLMRNRLAFHCEKDELECFPPMGFSEFHLPYHISNAIIEIDKLQQAHILHIIKELNSVECLALEIRILNKIDIAELECLILWFDEPDVQINELNIVTVENDYDFETLKELFKKNLRLTRLIISDATKNENHSAFFVGNSHIAYTTRKVHLPSCCGNFSTHMFVTNLPFFTESQHHNTCLHRKVAIDKEGNIKNCPSMSKSFGNISDVHLVDIIEDKEFTKLWNINKNQINICQDCEFRHVCMDCRTYLENPNDIYSKPLKCGYNPYTMEWEDWSTNPLKKQAIQHYNLKDL